MKTVKSTSQVWHAGEDLEYTIAQQVRANGFVVEVKQSIVYTNRPDMGGEQTVYLEKASVEELLTFFR